MKIKENKALRSLTLPFAFCSFALCLTGGTCGSTSSKTQAEALPWDKERVQRDLKFFSAEPHPMGSARMGILADYLDQEVKTLGLTLGRDQWTAEVPDPELLGVEVNAMRSTTLPITMQNLFAKLPLGKESCVFLIASHYDSKRLESGDGIGANDSGSSSVAILELLRGLSVLKPTLRCHLMMVWFDGEEAYLPDWRDGQVKHPARIVDNTYGSRRVADSLKTCDPGKGKGLCLPESWGGDRVEGLLLLDMVGMPDLRITRESNSDPRLLDLAQTIDREMFAGKLFTRSTSKPVEDDHIPFVQKGIPSLDLIGFEDISTWHLPSDTFERVSIESIEQSARLSAELLQRHLAP